MKILEFLEDRNGKLSIYKLCFFLGANFFLIGWIVAAIHNKTVPEMPTSLSLFLGVLGASQLGKSFLANQEKKIDNEGK